MPADELLITGHYGDTSRFALNVASGRATIVLTHIHVQGEDASWKQASDAVTALRNVLNGLVERSWT